MVQKEVRKKTKIYGTVAVLSAIVLVSMIYVFGSTSTMLQPNSQPNQSGNQLPNQPISQVPNQPSIQELSGQGMKTFSSLDELATYLNNTSREMYVYSGSSLGLQNVPAPAPTTYWASPSTGASTTDSYSNTNVQVAGVDEADTVKTDGQYIYTVSSITSQNMGIRALPYYSPQTTSNILSIIKADPQDPRIISKIDLGNDTQQAQLYLSPDDNKLVVLASKYEPYNYDLGAPVPQTYPLLPPYFEGAYTYINVYDISNKASPTLTRNFTVTGNYFNSRMIGNYVYAVVSQSAMVYNNNVTLPAVYNGKIAYAIAPTSVYYANMTAPSYYQFTSFFGIDVLSDTEQPTNMTVLMGGASTMYVSQSNIYVTYPTWNYGSTFTYGEEYTSIYRVSINGAKLTFEAQGNVSGYVINQYAMDENNGYFRIATHTQGQTQTNNLYVLNSNLTTIGKLEGLAQNENLDSVRFMGDKCYLVTFIRTDPLFVIDLSQPNNPKVLGSLSIPGYSNYLHPYDETHLIGVGKETVASDTANFAWYQGLKLSLFDVSDVNNPTQLSKYVIGDRGTNSLALSDPKAFLFDQQKHLLVIPVDLAIVDNSTGQATTSSYGTTVWQGAYVFNIDLNTGLTLKGTVTHLDPALLNSTGYLKDPSTYWSTQNNWITRSLYIGNTLYTISNAEIKLNSLTDMTQIAQVNLT